jgi:uncharacterized circularly permuted ATP-grasp superfamily protein/uncharacterized alpha-E superfamily protein
MGNLAGMSEFLQTSRMQYQAQKMMPSVSAYWHEVTSSDGQVREHWVKLQEEIQQWNPEQRAAYAAAAGRQIEEFGTTFNVFSDVGGAGQPYQLDPIPLVIAAAEWNKISAGLAQRIRLLNAVLADIYGPQQLLRDGLIPPDMVHASSAFQMHARGVQPVGGNFLHSTGCDMVRTANGNWTVLRDHTGTPGGIGQTLENRKITSEMMVGSFEQMDVAPLMGFIDAQREVMRSLSIGKDQGTNVVFLTPGFQHPSYFEHAYKAKLLGFPLVEAADLTVRERRLFLKTLAGLRRVDVLVCRVDHDGIDPLEHWGGRSDGVAGLIEAWRAGNTVISNAPGSSFASSPALMPFLPRICREWFGEEMKLPFVETWWLGQKEIRESVFANFSRYVLLSASPQHESPLPLQCSELSPSARKQWIKEILEHPHDFVVQVAVRPSEIPTIENRQLRQRPLVWRGYAIQHGKAVHVMSGGLARVGKGNVPPQLWSHHAGYTKDVWVVGMDGKVPHQSMVIATKPFGRGLKAQEVPSRIAEQLFWVGRYAERLELSTRLLRVTLSHLVGGVGSMKEEHFHACHRLLQSAGLIAKEKIVLPAGALSFVSRLIHEPSETMGMRSQISLLMQNAIAARDRLSDDTWRFFNRLDGIVQPTTNGDGFAELTRKLDQLILHMAAFAGMQAENMTRGHGWRFLEIGRRLERGIGTLTLLDAAAQATPCSGAMLEALLQTCDSVMTYRRRHFSTPELAAVVDLLFADASNPRAFVHQVRIIRNEIDHFPGHTDFGLMPRIREDATKLVAASEHKPGAAEPNFCDLSEDLERFSDSLTQHFFSHSVRRVY